MRLKRWALVAEIVGGVAIILSLVFVGLQIADGNREARAATMQSILNAEMNMMSVFTQHADVWDKIPTGSLLAPGEETS